MAAAMMALLRTEVTVLVMMTAAAVLVMVMEPVAVVMEWAPPVAPQQQVVWAAWMQAVQAPEATMRTSHGT